MKRAFKTEVALNPEQETKFFRTIGVCRYVYNLFIDVNRSNYQKGIRYMNAKAFSVWLNHDYLENNPDKKWIKEVSSKAVKKSLEDANTAYRKFLRKTAGFPRFKKKFRNDSKMYFVKTDAKAVIRCERHRIRIPTLGWVRIKEKGYLPTKSVITSGTLSAEAGRFYVSVLTEVPAHDCKEAPGQDGIGIDLGIKTFATLSDGRTCPNINHTPKVKKLEKKLKREQRCLSRKYHAKKKGGAAEKNIRKQLLKVEKVHQRLKNIRHEYIRQTVNEIVRTKPSYVAVEDLNVKGMMKNRHLAKAIAEQDFYFFRQYLVQKCGEYGIEVRLVDRWYPSSKTCHECGKVKRDLKLSERVFRCSCGYTDDRDHNASLNLRDAAEYVVA